MNFFAKMISQNSKTGSKVIINKKKTSKREVIMVLGAH